MAALPPNHGAEGPAPPTHDHQTHSHASHAPDAEPVSGDHTHGDHDHGDHDHGLLAGLLGFIGGHTHDLSERVDAPLEADRRGMRALWISLGGLGVTALIQGVVVALSGSAALLGETFHNLVDALTAVPLGIAFTLARRPPNRRYTYGYGRAEDLAGVIVLLTVGISTLIAAAVSIHRLAHPRPIHDLVAVGAAAVVGLIGNELVAAYRIAVGRRIGSAALIADGKHARTDGLSSVAVLMGVVGVALGWQRSDALAGLVIVLPIAAVLRTSILETHRRLMDAVDPALVSAVERVLEQVPGVLGVDHVRMRWIGHELHAEAAIVVDGTLSVRAGHDIAEEARHRLIHDIRRLRTALIHADPQHLPGQDDPHAPFGHHQ